MKTKLELSEKQFLESIDENIKKLLAVFAIQDKEDEYACTLRYSPNEISELTGIPPGTVRGKWSKISKRKKINDRRIIERN